MRTGLFRALALLVCALVMTAASCTPKPAPAPEPAPAKTTAPAPRPTTPTVTDVLDDPPRTMYAARPGVKLFSEPRISPASVARLAQGQEVVRFRVRGAFAYVEVEETGDSGWVEGRLLSDEVPAATPSGRDTGPGSISETF